MTLSTPSPDSSDSANPGRSSPMAAITVRWVPMRTCGSNPRERTWATMWSSCSVEASDFITTITVTRPPEFSRSG